MIYNFKLLTTLLKHTFQNCCYCICCRSWKNDCNNVVSIDYLVANDINTVNRVKSDTDGVSGQHAVITSCWRMSVPVSSHFQVVIFGKAQLGQSSQEALIMLSRG